MSSELISRVGRLRRAVLALLLGATLAATLWIYHAPAPPRLVPSVTPALPPPAPPPALSDATGRVLRDALDLRDGRLYLKATGELFTGTLIERYSSTALRASIEILDGRAHGLSSGWYDTGEPEVRETFADGRSEGLRTRWYKNGRRRSEAEIHAGQLNGPYREWHENGQLAIEMTMVANATASPVRRWTPAGQSLPDLPLAQALAASTAP